MASQLPVEEASKEGSSPSPAANLETLPRKEESPSLEEQVEQKKTDTNNQLEETEADEDKKKTASLVLSPLDRPSREKKSVERFAALSPRLMSATKTFPIQQGSGKKLKDIPNVVFKLSKLKVDDNLRVLHRFLFGRISKVHSLKKNILQFSGFVWSENEEKEKSKVLEKLNKFNKGRLLHFCNLLDIYTIKSTTKKEEISAKLLEFLESPHVTREVIHTEKTKNGKKRKRGAQRTVERPLVVASQDSQKKKKKKNVKDEADEANKGSKGKGNSNDSDDESADEGRSSDEEETSELSKSKVNGEENYEIESERNSPAKGTKRSPNKGAKSKKATQSSKTKIATEGDSNISSKRKTGSPKDAKDSSKMKKGKLTKKLVSNDNLRKVSKKVENSDVDSPKSKNDDGKKRKSAIGTASKDMRESKKQKPKAESNIIGKKQEGERKASAIEPSTEQLSTALREILKEVDFHVATLADIIRQLGVRFNTDLMPRKAEIKKILQEVLDDMTDDEDDDEDDSLKEGEKN